MLRSLRDNSGETENKSVLSEVGMWETEGWKEGEGGLGGRRGRGGRRKQDGPVS